MSQPWPAAEFEARLRAVGERRYHHLHPFNQRMHAGQLSPNDMRLWIANRFYYQKNVPVKDGILLSKLPTREDRRLWLQRIIDQDGREGNEGGLELWVMMGEAAGLERDDLWSDRFLLPGVRFAVDAYVTFVRERPWLEGVAASLTELFAPGIHEARLEAFRRHYPWIRPEGYRYSESRLSQARRDVQHGLSLVLQHARTREDQERCVAALEFKCDVLWSLLDAVQLACEQRRAA
ncbi:MAG: pyrroloquinoline-quinone synthase PqqC [Limnochordaceae bacterium]|uniref:Pyrroloquinoline-quinone synthase n=1 Tax=Carboxydichorda subterranea TaxID=3109565 RepID=A0ABZ1BXX2_9FIRM|nr:pyrroloquinoline-quinone synthase PqqC [Limnochorda sp. L945t]MBE3597911.1 pyrroloquinoline-quinone synthase PqqC [Limnochordaceae bacterium]WRP17475.1 pyrroloquinoline-quinone synthase PqqC [Limnochorda sp. L945t]